MSHFLTTHDYAGNAVFFNKLPMEHNALPTGVGSMSILFTTQKIPTDISTDSDIDQYVRDRSNGTGSRLCPENGTVVALLTIEPNKASSFHRTMTLDTCVIIEGVMELQLDSGEKRTLSAGDSVVQRAVMHKWVNVTPNDGWAKMVAFAQPVVEGVEVGGKKLEAGFIFP